MLICGGSCYYLLTNVSPPTPYRDHVRIPTRLLSDMVVETSPAAAAASGAKATYACQVCHRAYERLDHLNRHLDSRKPVPEDRELLPLLT
jgi:hypothetical protein